jgi:hypothetical protein
MNPPEPWKVAMPRRLTLGCLSAAAFAALALAQPGPTKADLEQQRKAAEKSLADRTREYDQVRKDARGVLADDFEKYEAKRKELQSLRLFQTRLLDEVPWAFTKFTDGKADKPEMLTFRKIQQWVEAARIDDDKAVNKDLKAKTTATLEQYTKALSNFKELIIDPLVKAGPPSGSDTFFRTYDELTAGVKQLEQEVAGYEKKLGDTTKRLTDTQAAVDAASAALAEAEGRLTGKWKLDRVLLYAEDKVQAGGSVAVWNKQSDIYWKTDILTPTSVSNLGRRYLVIGSFTPPPTILEPGKPFDVTFQGSFSQSEKDVGWPGVVLDVMGGEASPDPKVKERVGFLAATLDGKQVPRAVFDVGPNRKTPSDRFTFTAPAAEDPERPLWRFMIRGWNTPKFGIVYQYKMLR